MRLTYSHVYSYENKYNLIGWNASNNLKKKNLTFCEIIYSHNILQNVLILFAQYSYKIIEIREKPPKHLLLLAIHWKWVNKQNLVNFELDKTIEKESSIKRQASGTSSDNGWYNEWQQMTTNSKTKIFLCWWFLLFLINKYPIINILSSACIFFV